MYFFIAVVPIIFFFHFRMFPTVYYIIIWPRKMKIIKPSCDGIMENAEEETRYLKFISHLDIVIFIVSYLQLSFCLI